LKPSRALQRPVCRHATIPGANHFFQHEMDDLMGVVDGYLDRGLANGGR